MRVLILHDYAGRRGGAEIIALELRRLLRERGCDARLMTGSGDPSSVGDAPDFVCRGDVGRLRALTETINLSAVARLKKVLAEFRPDVVHIVMFMTQLSPAILSVLGRVPTVYSISTYRAVCPKGTRWIEGHGSCTLAAGRNCIRAGCFSALGMAPRRLQLELVRRYRHRIDMTVGPSRAMAEILEGQGWPVHRIIPNGVPDFERTRGLAETPLIGYAGRLVREKGVGWLISAFAAAGEALGQARLLIIGDGPERAALTLQAKTLGVGERVEFLGHRSRESTQSLLEPAWVQVAPSLWSEPFGLVVAEAMMRGTALVVGEGGAPAEMVRAGACGIVVPLGDTGALASALAAMGRDQAERLGAAGRQAARRSYTEQGWIDAYLAAYRDVIGAAAPCLN